jgi:hypothetical protein
MIITDVVGEEEAIRVLPDGVDPSVAGEVNGDPKPSSGRAGEHLEVDGEVGVVLHNHRAGRAQSLAPCQFHLQLCLLAAAEDGLQDGLFPLTPRPSPPATVALTSWKESRSWLLGASKKVCKSSLPPTYTVLVGEAPSFGPAR